MFSVCLRYMGERKAAEDVLQDAFVTLFSKIDSFSDTGSFDGWARRIFVNTALMSLRKKDALKMSDDLDSAWNVSSDMPSQVQDLGYKELMQLVAALPAGYRTVFNMYVIEGFSHDEIAKALNISAATSRSQLLRARAMLQDKIKNRKDAKFVIIDGSPNDGQGNSLVAENTVSIFFAEHEAGFLSGLAAALQLKEAELGFIGGMEVSSVQRFNWGFQQGITYANENLGTNVSIKEENVVYSGSFTDAALGQQLAAQMYDRGVTAIFQSAAATGNGVISEAKQRAALGENVWVIGVDLDQYEDGIYDEANGKSVILTSAVKKINNASFDMIEAAINDQFPGGKTLVYSVNNNGVGIPEKNPNLDSSVVETVNEILEKMKNGEVTVSDEQGDLIR